MKMFTKAKIANPDDVAGTERLRALVERHRSDPCLDQVSVPNVTSEAESGVVQRFWNPQELAERSPA